MRPFLSRYQDKVVGFILCLISLALFVYYYQNGLGLAYSDAQSHLNIARRIIDNLTPGFAQIGSIWLPLPHLLMLPTIWNDFMWHSGLSGALVSMIAYVAAGVLIFKLLRELGVPALGRIMGVSLFALNPNILYLQSTAMTELLLLATMMAGAYYFFLWTKKRDDILLIKSAFWIMLSTLVRYEGWVLLFFESIALLIFTWRDKGWRKTEGNVLAFCFLGGFGIFLWVMWNWVIFGDPLYFAFGPFSAHTQQENFSVNGLLVTQHDALLSAKIYSIAVTFCVGLPVVVLSILGMIALYANRQIAGRIKFAFLLLISPFFFNILSLYLGHTILFMPGVLGTGWFNVRYGVMTLPFIAIAIPFLFMYRHKLWQFSLSLIVLAAIVYPFSYEPVTLQDAKEGMARKDLRAAAHWLRDNVENPDEKILISGAANDPIIFQSGFPIKQFIYEGSGRYWTESIKNPAKYATWVFADKKNSMDYIATKLLETDGVQKKFELVHEDEWFIYYRIIGKPFSKVDD
jgi:hypothetical protein